MNTSELIAIDRHTHAEVSCWNPFDNYGEEYDRAADNYFGSNRRPTFPPQLIQYANTLLKDRMLFGSDYPLITPERWMKDFDEAGFKDKLKPLILKENAKRLLGLS